MVNYLEWFVLAFPALGALVNGLLGKWLSRRAQNWVACGAVVGALLALLPMFAGQAIEPGLVGQSRILPWIKVRSGSQFFEGPLALRVDALSILVALTIASVGLLIHLTAARRLAEQRSRHVVLAILNGTLAALFLLTLADNFLAWILGWSLAGWGMCGLVQNRRKSLVVPVFFLGSDLCLLLAVGVMSQTFATLSVDDVALMKPALTNLLSVAEASPALVILFVLSAAIRAAQFPFHVWLSSQAETIPGADAFLYALVSVPTSIFLIARIHPLIVQVSFAPALLSWWGVSSALLMALIALTQSDIRWRVRYVAIGQGGLLLLALGQGQRLVVLVFLPAYMLLQAMVFLAVEGVFYPTRSRQDGSVPLATRRATLFGLLALTGFPLLPGFFLSCNLIASTFYGNAGLWVLTVLAVLLMAANAFRAIVSDKKPSSRLPILDPASGILFVMATGGIVLGLFNLTSPPVFELFLEPVLGRPGPQPAWWWFGITACVVGLGAGLGYWSHLWPGARSTRVVNWIVQVSQDSYRVVIAKPLLVTGKFIACELEGNLVRWTLGALAQWMSKVEPPDNRPDESSRMR